MPDAPDGLSAEQRKLWLMCSGAASVQWKAVCYFLVHLVWIENATMASWIRFDLWPAQVRVVRELCRRRQVIILKARQLGLTWLLLGYALWLILFRPGSVVLLFSRRDEEAIELLDRLKGMYSRLPAWMRCRAVRSSNKHEWELSNGSAVRSFPTTAGDSYTASLVVVDEADIVPDLGKLMRAVKPTVDAGGQMCLLSRSDKDRPMSRFKKMYRAAVKKTNEWFPIFLPWHARPERDQAWYDAQVRDALANTGTLDDVHEQYPATDTEALAAPSLSKRIPPQWIDQCADEADGVDADGVPNIPGLTVYAIPAKGSRVVAGADPAEGLPTSDDSACTWIDDSDGEEIASLVGKIQPDMFAAQIGQLSRWIAEQTGRPVDVLPERNNHGHSLISNLEDEDGVVILDGHDGRPGWLSNAKGKAIMYTEGAEQLRDRQLTLHTAETRAQLNSVERATLRAPDGMPDDLADSTVLAAQARAITPPDNETEAVLL